MRLSGPMPGGADAPLDGRVLRVGAVVMLGGFMSILDTTVVNVALRGLSRGFGAPLASIQWVATAYTLALATVIPLAGWASDRFGTRRVYVASLGVFVAGSALCALAWSPASLTAFRVLQGLGGGMIMPVGMTAVGHAAGPRRIGRVMAIVGVPMLVAPVVGPTIGGWLLDVSSWRWIFLVNLPVGALAIPLAIRFLEPKGRSAGRDLDVVGLLLLPPGLALFVYGLAGTAQADRPGASAATLGLAAGAAMMAGFVVHASRSAAALIDVRLFLRGTVAAGAAVTFLFGVAFFSNALLVPLFFQVVRGETAFATGTLMAVQGVGAMLAMPVAGRMADRFGAGPVVVSGLSLTTAALFAMGSLVAAAPTWRIEAALFALGLGMGSTMMPAMAAALGGVERGETARASAGLNVVQRVGGSVGTALAATFLAARLSRRLPGLGAGAGAVGLLRAGSPSLGPDLSGRVALAFGDGFLLASCFAALAIGAAVFLPRRGAVSRRPPAMSPAGSGMAVATGLAHADARDGGGARPSNAGRGCGRGRGRGRRAGSAVRDLLRRAGRADDRRGLSGATADRRHARSFAEKGRNIDG